MKKLILLCSVLALMSCTENQRARRLGGTSVVNVKKGQRVVEATWKEDQLWYLTESMDSNYTPKDKVFHEESSWGIIEGDVIFKETK